MTVGLQKAKPTGLVISFCLLFGGWEVLAAANARA